MHCLQILVLQIRHVHQVQRIRLQRCQCLSLSTEGEVSTVDHQNSIVVFRSRGTRLDLRRHLGQDPPKGTEEVIAVLLQGVACELRLNLLEDIRRQEDDVLTPLQQHFPGKGKEFGLRLDLGITSLTILDLELSPSTHIRLVHPLRIEDASPGGRFDKVGTGEEL